MAGNIKNIAASVHQRLLGKARESARPFNEFLQHFAIERFIYRLSRSPQADRFILKVAYPTLLDFPAPQLKGYTMESTIAEKFQAMVKLGILNSRMKDFYDVWLLSHLFDFKGEMLADAPEVFEDVVAAVKVFLEPLVASLAGRRMFHGTWNAPGPWR